MASYAVGSLVEYRSNESVWHEGVVLVDNTGDNIDLIVRHPNGPQWETKAGIDLGTANDEFRVK